MVTYMARIRINRLKIANPARGQVNRENEYFPVSPFVCTYICMAIAYISRSKDQPGKVGNNPARRQLKKGKMSVMW